MAQSAPASATVEPGETMAPFLITESRVASADVEGPQDISQYDAQHIESTGAFSVEEFIETLPSPEPGTTQLVLIDGRPTYLDPNSLPIGMIADIEVSNEGSMPQYGAFNNGRIINIRLKKDYARREVGAKFSGAFAGGGSARTARFAGGVNRQSLRVIYSLELAETRPLLASDRDFSRDQDLRNRGGRDLRLAWGDPPVIASLSGPLAGRPDGSTVALVPVGSTGQDLTPVDFLPPDPSIGDTALNQRRFNTSSYRWLVSPSQRTSLNLGFTYTWSERLQFSLNGSHTDSRGERLGAPPVTPASDLTRVPAAYNPFGQDISVGLVHVAYGPTFQNTRSKRDQIGLELNGKLGDEWQWEASAGHRRSRSEQSGDELDPVKFAAALQAGDPAGRFDPFIDQRLIGDAAALYSNLTSLRFGSNRSASTEAEMTARGPAFQLPGGPAQLRLGLEVQQSESERLSTRTLGEPPEFSGRKGLSQESSASLSLPFVSSRNPVRLMRRLEAQLSTELGRSDDGERERDVEGGLVWSPVKALLLRGRLQRSVETPSETTVAGSEILIGETLIDLRRGGETVTDVRVFTRENVVAEPEESDRYSFGATFEPPQVPGLRVSVSYRGRRERQIVQDDFDPQEIINNESALGTRVVRAEPTDQDLAAGRPGAIVAVDLTPGNTGEASRSDIQYEISYRPQEWASGQWRFSAEAGRALTANYEVLPGVPYVSDGGGGYHRPRWTFDGLASWSHGSWNASARARHTGAIAATEGARNGVDAYTTVDLNAGYRWRLRGSEGRSRDLRVTAGVGNVFDAEPPFADTVSGYRGGSPLGRTYSASFKMEF